MSFQKKLNKQLLFYSLSLTLIAVISLGVGLYLFNSENDRQLLTQQSKEIVTKFKNIISSVKNEDKNQVNNYSDFLKGELPSKTIYYNFSLFQSTQPIKSNLLITNKKAEIKYSSSKELADDSNFQYFLNLVLANRKEEETSVTKLYKSRNNDNSFLIINRIVDKGFSVHIFNQKEIENNLNQIGANYLISNEFDDKVFSSSLNFINQKSNKIDTNVYHNEFKNNENLYIADIKPLGSFLKVMTYKQGNSLMTLLTYSFYYILPLGILMSLLSFYFGRKIAAHSAKSVSDLKEQMHSISQNSSHRIIVKGNDEFSEIGTEINDMLNKLETIHQRNIDLLEENIIFERKTLEAQFNPHFLYNTLEVIRSCCLYDGQLANHIILLLTAILQYSVNNEIDKPTLSQDLTYIEKYLEIASIRFEECTYNIEMPPDLADISVPKLVILPLIENSLKYGFKYRADLDIKIKIVRVSEEMCVIEYSDNGMAMSAKEIDIQLRQMNEKSEESNHHGLINCQRRMQIMYPNADLFIFNYDERTYFNCYFSISEVNKNV